MRTLRLKSRAGTLLAASAIISLTTQAVHAQVFNVLDYGATGNGTTPDHVAIQAAADAAGLAAPFAILEFPASAGYLTTEGVQVPVGVSVIMDAPIHYAGPDDTVALRIGADGVRNDDGLHHRLDVYRDGPYTWPNGSVGIEIHNANHTRIEIARAAGFQIGVRCVGSKRGFGLNEVRLGRLSYNKYGLVLTNTSDASSTGWCNENLFVGGAFGGWKAGHSNYGILITSEDGGYTGNNNNLFLKPSFEFGDPGTPYEALPIHIEHGNRNAFVSCRMDPVHPWFARVENNSAFNEFDVGWGDPVKVDDLSAVPTSWVRTREQRLRENPGSKIFASGALHRLACYYDSLGQVHTPGVFAVEPSTTTTYPARDAISITDSYLEFDNQRGLGVFIDTQKLKRFVVRRDVEVGFGGRIWIRCYDSTGEQAVLITEDGHVTGQYPGSFYYAAAGSGYVSAADTEHDLFFQVDEQVKKVALFITGGTNVCRLRGFSVFSVDGGYAAVWCAPRKVHPGVWARKVEDESTDRETQELMLPSRSSIEVRCFWSGAQTDHAGGSNNLKVERVATPRDDTYDASRQLVESL